MLPILTESQGDWSQGTPPEYPQSKWWSSSRVVETGSCLMNVIEINLDSPMELDYLIFESLGALPAFGVVAASAEIVKD